MEKDKQIKNVGSPHSRLEAHWSSSKRKHPGLNSYLHEIMCGDLYVSCTIAGAEQWEEKPEFGAVGLIPDATCFLAGKRVYWEADRNTESPEKIIRKCEKYVKVSRQDNPFYVVFVAHETNRANQFIKLLGDLHRRNQFLVTLHEYVRTSPLMSEYVSPSNPSDFQFLSDIDV